MAALLEILRKEGRPVRLVKPDYLIELYEKSDKPIARRQELPEEAFLDLDALSEEEVAKLAIVVISYCWASAAHPDPSRYHLETLWAILKLYVHGCQNEGGGQGRTVGVFLDWASLFQEPRDEEKTKLFKDALRSINTWYAHAETTVFKLTTLPEGVERAGYAESGWPCFEAAVSRIIKPRARVTTIDTRLRQWFISEISRAEREESDARGLALALNESWAATRCQLSGAEAFTPLEPECFDSQVASMHFTNGADRDRVVKPAYERTFREVVRDGIALVVEGNPSWIGPSPDPLEAVRVWAKHCHGLRTIDFNGCSTMDLDLADLVGVLAQHEGRAEGLERLRLWYNGKLTGRLGDLAPLVGLRSLELAGQSRDSFISGEISEVTRFASLQELIFIGLKGIGGDVSSLAQLPNLRKLELDFVPGLGGDIVVLGQLAKLETLNLRHMDGLSGDPSTLARLSNCSVGIGWCKHIEDFRQ